MVERFFPFHIWLKSSLFNRWRNWCSEGFSNLSTIKLESSHFPARTVSLTLLGGQVIPLIRRSHFLNELRRALAAASWRSQGWGWKHLLSSVPISVSAGPSTSLPFAFLLVPWGNLASVCPQEHCWDFGLDGFHCFLNDKFPPTLDSFGHLQSRGQTDERLPYKCAYMLSSLFLCMLQCVLHCLCNFFIIKVIMILTPV